MARSAIMGQKAECIKLDDDGEVTRIADPKTLRPVQKAIDRITLLPTSTKQRINEKAKSSLGPSSIYDELYEEGGGVMENTSFTSVPTWNQSSQVPEGKTQRTTFKGYSGRINREVQRVKGVNFFIRLQVSPEVRVVLTTRAQLADLVKFCCNQMNIQSSVLMLRMTVVPSCYYNNIQALDASMT
ncbi:hypothetical protein OS493_019304 [Desmophyllum pertusum]|uniref:Uncharacterized protein n=1 Tax=Desmophyllum pertusum TaxID=174260 RepID=A0A9X0A0E8_9CNID|nr:hypothetical protein OS493_019304 [Desmophyllum pertusum]